MNSIRIHVSLIWIVLVHILWFVIAIAMVTIAPTRVHVAVKPSGFTMYGGFNVDKTQYTLYKREPNTSRTDADAFIAASKDMVYIEPYLLPRVQNTKHGEALESWIQGQGVPEEIIDKWREAN